MRTKKVKPPPKAHEYRLKISKEYDEIHKKDFISFKFQTTKEFLTFRYVLKIETEIIEKKIVFRILGFSAPVGELSVSGVAVFEYRMYDFAYGLYNVCIERKDSSETKFKLELKKTKQNSIRASYIPKDSFIEIISE